MNNTFDYTLKDSQATLIKPIRIKEFNVEEYYEYQLSLEDKCKKFWNSKTGVAIYRRFRVAEIFSSMCKDKKLSLSYQLSALKESMKYKTDIPNFLEPWYGIGIIASSFGIDYEWHDGQAPATIPPFSSIKEALNFDPTPIDKTDIGKHVLEMIEYFLEKTKGKIPISLTDIQSPFNTASYLVDTNTYYMSTFDSPDELKELLDKIADLLIDFSKKQEKLIGDCLAKPGHGFASHTQFNGIGMSDDNITMISPALYQEICVPSMIKIGKEFNGTAFHSCGNWSNKIDAVKKINNLVMLDGAFTIKTDPDPNPTGPFSTEFNDTGICINARMVGSNDEVFNAFKELYNPKNKIILVTYCDTIEKQNEIYNMVYKHINK